MSSPRNLPALTITAVIVGLLVGCSKTAPRNPDAPLALPLKPDVPEGYADRPGAIDGKLRQDIKEIQFDPLGDGKFRVALRSDGGLAPAVPFEIDLKPFVAHVPRLARGNETLTRVALMQQELNRNQTTYGRLAPERGSDREQVMWVANNCLRCGLWEVGIDRPTPEGAKANFHAWLDLPRDEYARLFEEINGIPFRTVEKFVTGYPEIGGFRFPLDALRKVDRDRDAGPITVFSDEPVYRLPEQRKKARLVLNTGIRTFGDFARPENQPIRTAKFCEPGFYNNADPMSFDLAWLAAPAAARWRAASHPAIPKPFAEIEITFADGRRLLIGDETLADLPPRQAAPQTESEALRLTFGIGTPDIYSDLDARLAEHAADPARYLLLLDRDGTHLDNHTAGLDRAYLWREAGDPGRLHLWLVGYERIALVAHYAIPWSAP